MNLLLQADVRWLGLRDYPFTLQLKSTDLKNQFTAGGTVKSLHTRKVLFNFKGSLA